MADDFPVPVDRPFESVYTVNEYYDGPRLGVADFDGRPHVYRSLWLDGAHSDDEGSFELAPLSPDGFVVVIEAWEIWRRFEHAHRNATVRWSGVDAEWGALPEEQLRWTELQPAVAAALAIDGSQRRIARGEFRAKVLPPADERTGIMHPLEVQWLPVE